ncbi:MAG: efflux RND transporter periplasmic adaptor subunit [Deltaproteobacteria bacterium]|nr:efflux RND transporter periplasmic adaptor subunit [Deltaproteobacteria bacterium]
MKARAVWITLVAGLALAAGGWFLYGRTKRPAGPKLETARVDRGSVVARVVAAGALQPRVTVQVGSQVSGRIRNLNVDFNDRVKKGQVIARIDPQLFEAAVEQARANHAAAEASLARSRVQAAEAQRQLRRTRALAERRLVAPADLDTARATAEAAEAQEKASAASLAQARAAHNQSRVNLAYTTIVSPIDGIVISRNVDVGQTVAASLQAPTLFTIAEDLRKMEVHTNVAEADIGRIVSGMPVTFTVDAYPQQPFKGAVRQVRNAPQTVQNVVTYDVVVEVENAELKLKPGMTANVTFVYAEAEDTLRVPNAALRFRAPAEWRARSGDRAGSAGDARGEARKKVGGRDAGRGKGRGTDDAATDAEGAVATKVRGDRRVLWVLRDGVPTPCVVRVGISDGSRTAIREGELREGDEVVTDAGGERGAAAPPGGGPGGGRGFMRRL